MSPSFDNVSAVILSGGNSSRMGRCKADLPWNGTSMLGYLVQMLRKEGITDIIASGYSGSVDGARSVPDIHKGKGPLCGIHSGLLSSENELCLIMTTDMPLVDTSILSDMLDFHRMQTNHISILNHGGQIEPLLGVYERCVSSVADRILQGEHSSVKRLFDLCGCSEFPYTGDERFLLDCDTPEDYNSLIKLSGHL